jgi:hypothetical protein
MEAHLAAQQRLSHVRLANQITFVQLEIGVSQVCVPHGCHVRPVKAAHDVAMGEQGIDEMRADKSTPTQHETTLGRVLRIHN